MDAMTQQWYVLRSKPNKEDALYKQVMFREIGVFYPCQTYIPVNPRARKTKPYFTGYMFVYTNLQETGTSLFQWMPYSAGLVNFDGEPAVIPINIMQSLIKDLESITRNRVDTLDGFAPGNLLKINSGPFAGYEAIFDTRLSGNDRIRVLLNLAKGSRMPVELSALHVEKIN
jgi:transcriptional antiterminator RfaH